MVCCDTTFLIDLIRKDANAMKTLEKFKDEHQMLSITVMTIAELYYGAYKSTKISAELAKIKRIIDLFLVFEMNEHSAEMYGKIRASLERKGMKVSDRDLLIAAISLAHGERAIITRNKEHFEKIHELEILSY